VFDDASTGGGIASGGSRPQQYALTLPAGPRGAGQIQVSVTVDYYDQLSESNGAGTGESNNSTTVTVTSALSPYADLQVQALALGANLHAGDQLVLQWNDVNAGTASVGARFSDHVVIQNTTTNQTLTSADIAYDPATGGAVAAGGSRARQSTYTLPAGAAGV